MASPGKICSGCHLLKPLDCFHPRGGGLQNYCKACKNAYNRRYRKTEKSLAYWNNLKASEDYKDYVRHYSRAYKKRSKVLPKVRARVNLQAAVRSGRLTRKPCEACGCPETHGHHDDYLKPLEVRWLCVKCHAKEHANQRNKNDENE